MCENHIKFGILTVSDSCFSDEKQDQSGPELAKKIKANFPGSIMIMTVVPDEIYPIKQALLELCGQSCDVILTTGGTGFSPKDVTPEVTRMVIEREAPGMVMAMITKSLALTDLAMLSRGVCGIRGRSLIVNLPGSKKAASECFDFIKNSLQHAVDLLNDDTAGVQETHRHIHGMSARVEQETASSKVKINVASRPRKSLYPLFEVDDAMKKIFEICKGSEKTHVHCVDMLVDHILAEPIIADKPYPPFPASIKDGYAVKYEDGAGPRIVRDAIGAGDRPDKRPLMKGEAIRISTGAPVPEGANAVVQVEDTTLLKASKDGQRELEINVNVAPKKGQDIRPVGSDISEGTVILPKFSKIDPAAEGVLATLGYKTVPIYRKQAVGVVSTGNELVCNRHQDLKPGEIRDSNKLSLLSVLSAAGYQSQDCGIARDNPDSVKCVLEGAFEVNDIIITTGGVSMGEFDLIKEVLLQDFDATIHFGRVNMKPGKPTTFATLNFKGKRKIVFALPGNPVSAIVTCYLFVLPALKSLENNPNCTNPKVKALVKGTPIVNNDMRPEFVRVKLKCTQDGIVAESTGHQISSRLNSVVGANGLLYLPGNSQTKEGEYYDAYVIGNLY